MSPSVPHCRIIGTLGLLLGMINHVPLEGRKTAKSAFPSLSKSPGAVVPIPVRETLCGPPVASSVMMRVPGRNPVAAGAKVTLMAQLAAGARVAAQLLVWAYSALAAILEMLRVASPSLVRVMV